MSSVSLAVAPDRLSDLCNPWFIVLNSFSTEAKDDGRTLEEVVTQFDQLLESIDTEAKRMNASQRSLYHDQARFILAIAADGVIRGSEWAHAEEWPLLEMRLFRTSDGGNAFFERMKSDGAKEPELQELFYLAIAVGFRGRYKGDEKAIRDFTERAYARFSRDLPDLQTGFTPEAAQRLDGTKPVTPVELDIVRWACVTVFFVVVVMAVAYALYESKVQGVARLAAEIAEFDRN